MSHVAWSAVCPAVYCATREPKTSLIDSLSAPGLPLVRQVGGVLRHTVGEFVADDVERDREAVEDLAVPVAEHHAAAVPVGVVVVLSVVDAGVEGEPGAVDGHTPEHVEPERVRCPEARVGLVHGRVTGVGRALGADQVTGERGGAVRVGDAALRGAVRRGDGLPRARPGLVLRCLDDVERGERGARRRGGAGERVGRRVRDGAQQVRRDDGSELGSGHGAHATPVHRHREPTGACRARSVSPGGSRPARGRTTPTTVRRPDRRCRCRR